MDSTESYTYDSEGNLTSEYYDLDADGSHESFLTSCWSEFLKQISFLFVMKYILGLDIVLWLMINWMCFLDLLK